MLSPDKTYHIISELANRRVALFHLLNGCWDAKKHLTNGHIVCLMLWFVCFALLATVYINIVWNMAHKERERGKTEQIQQITHTHNWLTLYIWICLAKFVCDRDFITSSEPHEALNWHIHMTYCRSNIVVWSTVSLLKRSQVSTPVSVQ